MNDPISSTWSEQDLEGFRDYAAERTLVARQKALTITEYEPSPEALAATPALPKALARYLSTGDVRQMRNDYEHAQMLHDWRNRNDWREIASDHWQDALAFAACLLADATRTRWHKAFWFGFGVTVVVCLVLILGGAR